MFPYQDIRHIQNQAPPIANPPHPPHPTPAENTISPVARRILQNQGYDPNAPNPAADRARLVFDAFEGQTTRAGLGFVPFLPHHNTDRINFVPSGGPVPKPRTSKTPP